MRSAPAGDGALIMALLRRGVPLTLLLDLADPRGPQSEDLLRHEATSPRASRGTG